MVSSERPRDLIVYDGECVMCSSFVDFVVKRDRQKRFRLVTAQSGLGRAMYVKAGLSPDTLQTNLVVVDGRTHMRLGAFAAVMNAIGWPWKILALARFIPWPLDDFIYGRIARNRLAFNRGSCPIPSADVRARLIE